MELKYDGSRCRLPGASRRRERVGGCERGFSLVEVLVAMLIFVGGTVSVAQLLVLSHQKHQMGRNTANATYLASAKFEELAKLSFATAAAVQVTPGGTDSLAANVANYFDVSANGYTRRWRVATGPTADTRLVTLRVIPPVSDRLTFRQVELTTILRSW